MSIEKVTNQEMHQISSNQRLLLKLLNILDNRSRVLTSSQSEQVYIDVKVSNEFDEEELKDLSLCSLTQDWNFVHSSWLKRSRKNSWNTQGSEYSGCVTALPFDQVFEQDDSIYHKAQYNNKEKRVVFNITDIFQAQVIENGNSFGWVLKTSGKAYNVFGLGKDRSSISGPRIYWKELN